MTARSSARCSPRKADYIGVLGPRRRTDRLLSENAPPSCGEGCPPFLGKAFVTPPARSGGAGHRRGIARADRAGHRRGDRGRRRSPWRRIRSSTAAPRCTRRRPRNESDRLTAAICFGGASFAFSGNSSFDSSERWAWRWRRDLAPCSPNDHQHRSSTSSAWRSSGSAKYTSCHPAEARQGRRHFNTSKSALLSGGPDRRWGFVVLWPRDGRPCRKNTRGRKPMR